MPKEKDRVVFVTGKQVNEANTYLMDVMGLTGEQTMLIHIYALAGDISIGNITGESVIIALGRALERMDQNLEDGTTTAVEKSDKKSTKH